MTSGFIRGDNLRYYSPMKYFVVMLALSVILPNDSFLDGIIVQMISGFKVADTEKVKSLVQEWNAVVYLPLVVILALTTRGFFREKSYNISEHLVIAAYGWGQMVFLSAVFFSAKYVFELFGLNQGVLVILFFIPCCYWFWYCRAVFSQQNIAGWLRAFATLPFALVFYLFVLMFGFAFSGAIARMFS